MTPMSEIGERSWQFLLAMKNMLIEQGIADTDTEYAFDIDAVCGYGRFDSIEGRTIANALLQHGIVSDRPTPNPIAFQPRPVAIYQTADGCLARDKWITATRKLPVTTA